MRYTWSFQRMSAARYALVVIDGDAPYKPDGGGLNVVYSPGYESSKPGDIIDAMLYLKSGHVGTLSGRTLQLLNQIRDNVPFNV